MGFLFDWQDQVLNYQPFKSSIVCKSFLKHVPYSDFREVYARMRRRQSWTLGDNLVPRVLYYVSQEREREE